MLLLKADTTFPKSEKASVTALSLMYWGRNNVTKKEPFPFVRAPYCCFWKLRIISLSPKWLWISPAWNFWLVGFDSKIKVNFEEEILCRGLISGISGTSQQSKCPSKDFSFTWAVCSFSRALCHTPVVCKLLRPARGGSILSSRAKS